MYFNGAQGTDAVLIKADDEGNEVWRNYYGGNGYDFAYSTTKTTDGNYASLITDCDGPDCGYFIVKINDNGNQIWSTSTFAYPGAYGTISSADDGGIVLSYRFNNQFWIEKRDINGNIDWSLSFPGLSISDVIQTSDGGYIFAGNDDSAFPRAVLVKLDNQANQEWSFTENVYPSNMSFFRNVIETSDGGFVVTGEVNDANYSMQIYMSLHL